VSLYPVVGWCCDRVESVKKWVVGTYDAAGIGVDVVPLYRFNENNV